MAKTFAKAIAPFRDINYYPPDWFDYTDAATFGHRFSWYYPAVAMPEGGFPCHIEVNNGFFANSNGPFADSTNQTITSANGRIWQHLCQGEAVAFVQVSAFNAATPALGSGHTTQNLFHMPGTLGRFYEGGSLANIAANGGKAFSNAASDCVHIIQHIRHNAALYAINPEKIRMGGSSSGSHCAAWAALAANRAGELGQGGQYEQNTVPNAFESTLTGLLWIDIYASTTQVACFPTNETGFVQAADLATAPARYRQGFSIWDFMAGKTPRHCPPTVWFHSELPNATQFCEPFLTGDLPGGTPAELHAAWPGLVFRGRMSAGGDTKHSRVFLDSTAAGATGIDTTMFDAQLMDDVDSYAAVGLETSPYMAATTENIGKPRWDKDGIPPGGIFRHGQVDPVGRVCVPANRHRGGLLIQCRKGGAPLLIGDSQSTATFSLEPGEKVVIEEAGHVWFKSETAGAVSLFNCREIE